MSWRTGWPAALAALLLATGSAAAAGAERSHPLDCLPDRLVAWNPVAADPQALHGAAYLPGIVLGPPGNSAPHEGSVTVATLGFGGSATLAFDDVVIEDRPGPDFIVFENAFFKLPLPLADGDGFRIFAEPAFVEVSVDGVTWHAFEHDPAVLAAASGVAEIDAPRYAALGGLAGVTPTFTGHWTVPDDRDVFDAGGTGGVSGAGGDAFDLGDVGLAEARYVRITDANTHNGFAGAGEGFDLDAVVALHARPAATPGADGDGDGLSDAAEEHLYDSDPVDDDTDGDGIDDGREVAGCRDPGSFDTAPWLAREPRLWVSGAACTELRWSFAGSGFAYDLVRGTLGDWSEDLVKVDLGAAACLADDHLTLRWGCDATTPVPGTGLFYLVRVAGAPGYGRSSSLRTREAFAGCP